MTGFACPETTVSRVARGSDNGSYARVGQDGTEIDGASGLAWGSVGRLWPRGGPSSESDTPLRSVSRVATPVVFTINVVHTTAELVHYYTRLHDTTVYTTLRSRLRSASVSLS